MTSRSCFVVQGFGPKTDYTDGRILDLDASYAVIKQAVEEAGLVCIRADEIVHAGTIDIPMYEQLLRADLVIADLSTYNVNAAFELGVRYALRPRATIVLAEEKFKSPFDINHIIIRRYKHLGEDIGRREAERLRAELREVIATILADERIDSPVYSMLHGLSPPVQAALKQASDRLAAEGPAPPATRTGASAAANGARGSPGAARGARAVAAKGRGARPAPAQPAAVPPATRGAAPSAVSPQRAPSEPPGAGAAGPGTVEGSAPPAEAPTAREWLARAQQAMDASEFEAARHAWGELRKLSPSEVHVVQQLALATYKSARPTAEQALLDAARLLEELSPATTNDPETLGLWGAVHKRLWELRRDATHLSEAVAAYERGYSLKQDHYNGINLAFLLNVRAVEAARGGDFDEAVADSVQAARVRRDLVRHAVPLLDEDLSVDKRYWIVASLWEAALGLGDATAQARWEAVLRERPVPDWMHRTREQQGERLSKLLDELAQLRAAAR